MPYAQVLNYIDDKGRTIKQYVPGEGQKFKDFVKYVGVTEMTVHGPHGQSVTGVEFAISAASLEEAFNKFDILADKKISEINELLNKPKLSLPGGQDPSKPVKIHLN